MEEPFVGPYKIAQVNMNDTVWLQMGPVLDTVNI
jgi:hypothetical protein